MLGKRKRTSKKVGPKKRVKFEHPSASTKLTGRGNYGTKIGQALSAVAPLGNMVLPGSGTLLSALGSGVQAVSGLFGRGDYKTSSAGVLHPVFVGPQEQIVTHREFLTDISATSAFTVSEFLINPGLVSTFPWMAQIAAMFEQYEVIGMVFEFNSISAVSITSGTNTAMGAVIMATVFDSLDNSFTSKQQMESYEGAVSAKPSDSIIHYVEAARRKTTIVMPYIRTAGVPAGADQRLYDVGKFTIATVGMQNTNVIGELWISYKIRLVRAKLPTPLGVNIPSYHAFGTTGIAVAGGKYLGTNTTTVSGYGLSIVNVNGLFTFPSGISSGRYLILYLVTGDSTAVADVSIGLTNNMAPCNTVANRPSSSNNATTTTVYIIQFTLDVTGPNPAFTISGGTLPANATRADLYLTQIPTLL